MPGPVPRYGARRNPNGQGTFVRDAQGREFLFGAPADPFAEAGYSNAHAPPAAGPSFDELDALGREHSQPLPPQSSAPAAFARSAAATALDTAALPVTLPARALRAAGVDHPAVDTAADLSADEALQDATWLATGEDAGDYRRRVEQERAEFPTATGLGAEVGALAAPLGRGSKVSAAAKASPKKAAAKNAATQALADAGGLAAAAKPWEPKRADALAKAYAGATAEEATEIATGRAPPRGADHAHNAGRPLPPVRVVVRTDVPAGKPPEVKISDGNHRAAAAKAAGASEILADVEVFGRGPRGGQKRLHKYTGPVPLFVSSETVPLLRQTTGGAVGAVQEDDSR